MVGSGKNCHIDLFNGSVRIGELCSMSEANRSRGYFSATLGCRCPRCREGKLFRNTISFNFKKTMEMNKTCPVCGQPSELEVGFYYGTSYVSYVLTVAISVSTLVAWYVLIGMSTSDNRFFYWLGFNSLFLVFLQPLLMRLSRSFWISWFVKHDHHWREHQPEDVSERLNPDQANNW
jgi:uncharacterized protein (DUF983 family)